MVTIEVTASVNGPLAAKVVATRRPFALSSAKVKGSATVFISNGTLSLDVMGFKQSSADPGSGTLTPPAG